MQPPVDTFLTCTPPNPVAYNMSQQPAAFGYYPVPECAVSWVLFGWFGLFLLFCFCF